MSRYKLTSKPELNQDIQALLEADAGIRVYIILLIYQKKQEQFAKTVTNLLILLTVL